MTANARTWLFVPGDRSDRFVKAARSGADEVICDLEDAVAPARKGDARRAVARWLRDGGNAWVRLNGLSTQWAEDDLAALAHLGGLRGFVVPKADDPAALDIVGRPPDGRRLIPLIESARGVHDAVRIAEHPAVDRLAFGSVDFALDIGAHDGDDALLYARSALVLASRVAGRPAPIDGVTTTLADPDAARRDAQRASLLGFGGKLCVHPTQVGPVAAAFRPTPELVNWARSVVAVADDGANAIAGQLVDRPVIERARLLLAAAESDH